MDTAFTAPDTDFPSPARPVRRVTIIANPKSGRNSRDRDAIASSLKIFGEDATLEMISSPDEIGRLVDRACTNGADVIVAAGGDGTATAVAAAVIMTFC